MMVFMQISSAQTGKTPRPVLKGIYAFAPNRDTLGGTAYFFQETDANGQPLNLLIDCPAWEPYNVDFITDMGGLQGIVVTQRDGIGNIQAFQSHFDCSLMIQEQEAYLLPRVPVTPFAERFSFSPNVYALWTPGYSPGSTCVYYQGSGGVLFTGRHILCDRNGMPQPLRFAKTFHWPRQLQHVQKLLDTFADDTLGHICPGANTGFLRGERSIANAHAKLSALDLQTLADQEPIL
jgi:glyoxylase-like metal-dependent hydrolase (beta-lactamase superfamily II)